MKLIISLIKELEVQISDEGQLESLKKIREAIEERAKNEDDLWEPDGDLTERIDAGIGFIDWNSNNLQLKGLMEDLEGALKNTSPLAISERLKH